MSKKALKRIIRIANVALKDDDLDGYATAVLEKIIETANQSAEDRLFEEIREIASAITGYRIVQNHHDYISLIMIENETEWEPVYGKTVKQALTFVLIQLKKPEKAKSE